mmetsp:Transcript_82109/g.145051  ORF Transcript_82109/g.145051 Transcript_82109/m.145051 type:complete len:85 (+) Transcript_82109:191-445(+)
MGVQVYASAAWCGVLGNEGSLVLCLLQLRLKTYCSQQLLEAVNSALPKEAQDSLVLCVTFVWAVHAALYAAHVPSFSLSVKSPV